MRISLVELPLQTVMGRVPVLVDMLSGARASAVVPYLLRVMGASIPRGHGAGLAYSVNGSPGWGG
jgi:hypothetical protein